MPIYCGIDLGTTNTVITCFSDGFAEPLSPEGHNFLPSCLYVDSSVYVGFAAKNRKLLNPERYICSSKRHMPNSKTWTIDGRVWTPEKVAAEILKKAADCIHTETGSDEEIAACITVPACFSDAACRATLNAARIAGIRCVGLCAEPVMAAFAYLQNFGVNKKILVVDIGGGTFDLSVVDSLTNSVLYVGGNQLLGGDDFDKAIADSILRPALPAGASVLPGELEDIARRIKEQLQEKSINSVHEKKTLSGGVLDVTVTLDDYINACASLRGKIAGALNKIIEQSRIDFDEIIVVGGMAKDPNIIETINSFPQFENKFSGAPEQYMNLVSAGAALQCWMKCTSGTGVANTVTFTSLGIASRKSNGELEFSEIIPAGTVITDSKPAFGECRFSYPENRNQDMNIFILESNGSRDIRHCIQYGVVKYPCARTSGTSNSFTLKMTLDSNRILTVYTENGTRLEAVQINNGGHQ